MREGQRDGDEESPETEQTDDGQPADEEPEAKEQTTADATEPTTAASTDGGATAATQEPESKPDPETEEGDDAATDESDPAVDAAVENVSGTRAELPSTERMEAAMEQTIEQAKQVPEEDNADAAPDAEAGDTEEPAGPAAGIAGDAEQTKEADTRILEFTLDDEQYCLDIQYIEEIVKHTAITRVPNTPDFVEGVVDLRGQITTILNPKVTIDKPNKEADDLIVVFDAEAFEDQGHIGWVVDDVRQVSPISEDDVNDPPMQEDYINGVIDRDDGEFVIWTTPDLALKEAE
jgi:purine-binding chemotaxis protein CheW